MQLEYDVMILDMALHSSQQYGLDIIAEVVKIKLLPITSLYEPELVWSQ